MHSRLFVKKSDILRKRSYEKAFTQENDKHQSPAYGTNLLKKLRKKRQFGWGTTLYY